MKCLLSILGLVITVQVSMAEEKTKCQNIAKAQANFIMACENYLLTQELGSTLRGTSSDEKKKKCTRVADNILVEKLTDESCDFWNIDPIMGQSFVQKYLY